MPVLLIPAALASLATLVMPLALHLARRSVLTPIDFAALRWLDAKRRPRSQWRLDEWLLLAFRLTLLTLIALWLARPAITGGGTPTGWVVVVPGAHLTALPAGERHWLAPGFAPIDQPVPAEPLPVVSLLREADAMLPPGAALTVVVPATIEGADAERPHLSRAVTWRIVPGTMPPAAAVPPLVPRLTVRYAPGRAGAVRFLRAAATAWQMPGHLQLFDAGPLTQPLSTAGALVWLGGPLSPLAADWVRRGGSALVEGGATVDQTVAWRDAGKALVTTAPMGRGHLLHLTRRLDPATLPQLLNPDFPARLRALFVGPPLPPARLTAADLTPLAGAERYPPPARDLQPWIALIIAIIFLVERVVASGRRATP